MNWFERYSIPGAYFLVHSYVWIRLMYPDKIESFTTNNAIIVFGISLIPIGYVLTIFQQLLYLWLPFTGILKSSLKDNRLESIKYLFMGLKSEPKIEARYSYHAVFKVKDLDKFKYLQEWSRKRMDVMAMSLAIILATISSIIIVFLPNIFLVWEATKNIKYIFVLSFFSISILFVMIEIWIKLRNSIKTVLIDILADNTFIKWKKRAKTKQ